LKNLLDCVLTWTDFKNQDWFWIAKYDSPLISDLQFRNRTESCEKVQNKIIKSKSIKAEFINSITKQKIRWI